MISRIYSAALWGVEAFGVCVETDASSGLPGFGMVGLPDNAVRESRERLLAALKNQGYAGIQQKVVVNLAPADRRKEGSSFDLPIALGVLVASEQCLPRIELDTVLVAGELGLDGSLLPIRGALNLLLFARQKGFAKMIVPAANADEVRLDLGVVVYGVGSLSEAVEVLEGEGEATRVEVIEDVFTPDHGRQEGLDFAEVRGQEGLRRALEVAAAGGHNFLLIGSPGSGKTMCARRLPSILPPLSLEESLETTRVHSAAGLLGRGSGLLRWRPFRAPHHTVSTPSLVGGGSWPRPGETSLAHHGVLFLDELPEYPRTALETLRQPLEDGHVNIARASGTVTFPSRFLLGAAMNPCPCGHYGDPKRVCRCTPIEIRRYRQKLSGPLLDRIDIQVEVPSLDAEALRQREWGESSASIRQRVMGAREIQRQRFSHWPDVYCNAHMGARALREFCALDPASEDLLSRALDKFGLSARAHDRILRVARTIADLESSEQIFSEHLSEALQYRCAERWDVHEGASKSTSPLDKTYSALAIGGKSALSWIE